MRPSTRSDFGARAAERMAQMIGSWRFLGVQTACLGTWVACNVALLAPHLRWDPYPFILLNLALSFQAAYTGPILLIASNRAEERDRARIEAILRLAESTDRAMDQTERLLAEAVALLRAMARKGERDAG